MESPGSSRSMGQMGHGSGQVEADELHADEDGWEVEGEADFEFIRNVVSCIK